MAHSQNRPAVENCMAVAGFSVGELTALIFSGAITFSEGINLVKIRGEAMQVNLSRMFFFRQYRARIDQFL